MRELMARLGWDLHFRDTANTMFSFNKHVEGLTLACQLHAKPEGRWEFIFKHIPGVQMLVEVTSQLASFPHPKFSRWEARMFDYARACEAVALTH